MEIGSLTGRTLPFRIVSVQRPTRSWRVHVAVFAAIVGAGLAPALATARATVGARDLFDELYERGQKQNAGLKTLTATFSETSTSSLLSKPLLERGTVFVERPTRVSLRYDDPEARVIVIDGDTMAVTWPSAKLHEVKDIGASQRRIQKYFVDSSAKELKSHFDVSAREALDRPGTYAITMVPKRKQILEGMTRLELWVDRTTLLLSAMRMTFPGDDSKTMTFTDIKVNGAIDPAMFR
jgi:outer membrane lipoprotein-sorting protein